MKPVVAPQRLKYIKGGHTVVDVANYLIVAIAECINLKDSAFHTIDSQLRDTADYDDMVAPPNYSKLGRFLA